MALFWSTNSQLVASLDVRHVVLLCVNKAKNPPGQQGVNTKTRVFTVACGSTHHARWVVASDVRKSQMLVDEKLRSIKK